MTERDSVKIRTQLVRGHWSLGEHEEAVLCLERAAAETPGHPGLLDLAGELLVALGGRAEEPLLEERLAQIVERLAAQGDAEPPIADSSPLATPTMAELLAGQGHTDRALEVAEDVLRRKPGDERALAVRSRLRTPDSGRGRRIAELERWLGNARRRAAARRSSRTPPERNAGRAGDPSHDLS